MSKSRFVPAFLLVMIGIFLFFSQIGSTSLWDNDESTYAEIAKEMIQTHNWLTPMFNREPWFCHPPLYMWMTSAAFKIGGWNEITARLFPSLFAILGMLMLFWFGTTWWSKSKGFMAAVILGTSLQVLIQGGMATMDTMLNTFLLLSFYGAWRGFEEQKRVWWVVFFVSCGLATLAKGVFGLLYPLFIFALYFAMTGQNKNWRKVPWGTGLLIYIAIAAPWFILETLRYGNTFLYQVFYFYTFKRVVSPILQQSGPWYYYFPVLLFGFFPWSGFLPMIIRRTWLSRSDPRISFLGLWALATFIFFTLVNTKLPNYIFFLYPPLALLLAHAWESFTKKEMIGGSLGALALVGLLIAGLKIFAGQKLLPDELNGNLQQLWPIMGILAAGTTCAVLAKLILKTNQVVFATLAATLGIFWLVLHLKFSSIVETYKPMKPLAEELRIHMRQSPASVLAFHVPGTASLIFYGDTPIENVNDRESFLRLWRSQKTYAFLDTKTLRELKSDLDGYRELGHRRTLWLLTNLNR